MEYLFFNREEVYLEDKQKPCIKLNKVELDNYLDSPVLTLNFYVDCFFKTLEEIGTDKINMLFKQSLNGYRIEDLISDFQVYSLEDSLPYHNKIEIDWLNMTFYDENSDRDEITEIVRARGHEKDNYFSLGNFQLLQYRYVPIIINDRYILEYSNHDLAFVGRKKITLRMVIDSLLYEFTINRDKSFLHCHSCKTFNVKTKTNATIKLIELQKELEHNIDTENYEKCSEIQKEINKYDKLIKDGK